MNTDISEAMEAGGIISTIAATVTILVLTCLDARGKASKNYSACLS